MDNFDRRAVIAGAAIVGAVATATGASAAAKRPPKPVPPAPEPVPPAPKPILRPVNLVFFAINPNSTLTLTAIPFADYNSDFLVKFASAFIGKVHENNIPSSGYYILDATTGESL
ncbi:MAG TPA: hypothetical protein VN805_17140 [Caulobacteraceae bacterium]|nr:hypothetical protein [Caulobacteraceae bacterium]